MVAEVFAGLSAFKAMFDLAKGLKDINDATVRNAAVIELQEQILTAQNEQATLIDKVRDLEKEVAELKAWDAEKQNYELKEIGRGSFACVLKPEAQGAEPVHWLCTQCYDDGKRSILQRIGMAGAGRIVPYKCNRCQSTLMVQA